MTFDKKVECFEHFSAILEEIDNNTESMRNYRAYINGKEPLRHAIINHREGDSAYDYIKANLSRGNFSIFPDGHWENVRKKYRKDIDNNKNSK